MQGLITVAIALIGSGCTLVPGTEMEMPEFIHYFDITYNDVPVQVHDQNLRFAAGADDFPVDWVTWQGAASQNDGQVEIGFLAPTLDVDAGGVGLNDDDQLCLKNPITIYETSTGDPVHEIAAGTCLTNEGQTTITINTTKN